MLSSINWKCKYCGNRARVAKVMGGRRVRCPACAAFSGVRLVPRSGSQLRGPHSTTLPERNSFASGKPESGGKQNPGETLPGDTLPGEDSLEKTTQAERGKHDPDDLK